MKSKSVLAVLMMALLTGVFSSAMALQDNPDFGAARKMEILADLLVNPSVSPADKKHLERLVANGPGRYVISSFVCDFINRSFRAECEIVLAKETTKGRKDVVRVEITGYAQEPASVQNATFIVLK